MAGYIPVLTFHGIDDGRGPTSFSPALFRRAVEMLHGNGYGTMSLTDAAGLVRRSAPLPDRSFVITFDDGLRSVYDEALPILRKHSYTATVFLTTGNADSPGSRLRLPPLGARNMLSWDEIREMKQAGFDFGAHSVTHPDLTALDTPGVEYEMKTSKEIIEAKLGAPVLAFAYPYGRYDARSVGIAERHFVCACSDRLGLLTAGSPLYALERVDACYLRGEKLLGLMMRKSFPVYLLLRNIPRALRRRLGGI